MVESIEHIHPELQPVGLPVCEVLVQTNVCGLDWVRGHDVSAAVAECSRFILGEGGCIEVMIQPVGLTSLVDVETLARHQVRSILSNLRKRRVVPESTKDGKGLPRLDSKDSAQLPSSYCLLEDLVRVTRRRRYVDEITDPAIW